MATASSKIAENKDFPAGLGVLVVDDDLLCLKVVEKMLKTCKYKGASVRPRAVVMATCNARVRFPRGVAIAIVVDNDGENYF